MTHGAEEERLHRSHLASSATGAAERLKGLPWQLAAVITVQVLFLLQGARTYWMADDLLNRTESGALANARVSYWHAAHGLVDSWWHEAGRFFPVSFYMAPPQYMALHNATDYKLLLIFWTAAASACVWLLLRELGLSRSTAAIVLLIATLAMQYRPQDALLSYAGLEQLVLATLALSLLCYHRWLRGGSRWMLAAGLLLFVISSLSYESSYVFGPLYALMALWERRRIWPAIKATIPVFIPSVIFLAIGSYGRDHALAGSRGPYAPSFSLHEIFYTFIDQFGAAVPLTYVIFNPLGSVRPRRTLILDRIGVWDVLLGLAFAGLLYVLARQLGKRRDERFSPGFLIVFGLGFWILTAGPIALASRYQAELIGGLGHIPAFMEYFAEGMVVVGVLAWVAQRDWPPAIRTGGVVALALVVGALTTVGHRANALFVELNQGSSTQGRTLESFARHVVGPKVATGSDLYLEQPGAGHDQNFYRQYGGKQYNAVGFDAAAIAKVPATSKPCTPQRPTTWWVRVGLFSPKQGWAILGCASGPGAGIMLRGISPHDLAVSALTRTTDPATPPAGVLGELSDTDLNQLPGPIEPSGIVLLKTADQPLVADWTGGCWAPENVAGVGQARWCQGTSDITVLNTQDQPVKVKVTPNLIRWGRHAKRYELTGAGLDASSRFGEPIDAQVQVPAHGKVHLKLRVVGADRLKGPDGGRDARVLVAPGVPVSVVAG